MGMLPKSLIAPPKEVLNLTKDFEANEDAIAAQMDGSPLEFVAATNSLTEFETALSSLLNYHSLEGAGGNTPDFILAQFLRQTLSLFGDAVRERDRVKTTGPIEATTFGFYVDGYSVHSTDTIGEVRVVRYDGKEAVIKSKSLTDYFDRRIDPPNVPKEGT